MNRCNIKVMMHTSVSLLVGKARYHTLDAAPTLFDRELSVRLPAVLAD